MATQINLTAGSNTYAITVAPVANINVTISRTVVGSVSANTAITANFANYAGNVTTSAQPNITSLGILSGLVVAGNITPNANITYNLGNNTNRFNDLYLANSTIYLGNETISANSTTIVVGNLAVTGTFLANNVVANTANYANYAGVSNVANSVAVANVSGIGNIATINLDGNSSNILYGNGVFAADASNGNANFASYAGVVTTNAQPNITSVGTLTDLTVSGNLSTANLVVTDSVGGNLIPNANITYDLGNATNRWNDLYLANTTIFLGANSTISAGSLTNGNSNIIVTLDGNVSTSVAGNTNVLIVTGAGVNVAGTLDATGNITGGNLITAGFANIGTELSVIGNANIGTDLSVIGNANVGNIGATNGVFTNVSGNGNSLSSIQGANVSGEVTFAATANAVAVANVSGIGNIATINLDGNASTILYGNGIFAADASNGNANYANFAGTAYSVDGANVVGAVADANLALQVADNTQSNITSVGTLVEVNTSGNINFIGSSNSVIQQDYANGATTLTIYAGNHASHLLLDGLGDANLEAKGNVKLTANSQGAIADWKFGMDGNLTLPGGGGVWTLGADTAGLTANMSDPYPVYLGLDYTTNVATLAANTAVVIQTNTGDPKNWTFDTTGNLVLPGNTFAINFANGSPAQLANANYANFAGTAYSVDGANVVGAVAYATTANAVAGANVSGEVTFAGTANAVAGANVSGEVTFAATANAVAGANVSGEVTFAATANAVAGANVSGEVTYAATANSVAVANVSGIGNIATINLNGNASTILYGNGVFAADASNGNANFASYAGVVTTNAQPNITSVGTLTDLNVNNTTIHLGSNAGITGQGANAIAIGLDAANTSQGLNAIAIGRRAGSNTQSGNSIAIGVNAAAQNQSNSAIAIGELAGYTSQSANSIAIGYAVATNVQGTRSIAIGFGAANTTQGANSVAIGSFAASNVQGANSIAIGTEAANTTQGTQSIAIGLSAGSNTQGANAVAIGTAAGTTSQGANAVAIGRNAGGSYQQAGAIAIGRNAGITFANVLGQGANAIAIGSLAGGQGNLGQGERAIAIGRQAGTVNQGANAIAIGEFAGSNVQSAAAIAIGYQAGNSAQGANSIAIGYQTSNISQGSHSIGIGWKSASNVQGANSIAIGTAAGFDNQGANSVAIGANAGYTSQAVNTIILNATGANLDQTTANTFTVKPVRAANTSNALFYNSTSGEISYDLIGNIITVNLDGNASTVLYGNGVFAASAGGNGTPGGSNTQIQFNDASAFGGNTGFTFDKTTGAFAVPGTATLTGLTVSNATGVVDFTTSANVTLGAVANLHISGGTANYVLQTNGSGALTWVAQSGGGNANNITNGNSSVDIATSGGVVTTSVAGNANIIIATGTGVNVAGTLNTTGNVAFSGANISLGAIGNVKITGGANAEFIRTDGAGNLSFVSVAETLLVGTRVGPSTVPITNYTFIVTARTGNVTIYVN